MNKTMRQVLIILIIKLDMKTKSINLLIISRLPRTGDPADLHVRYKKARLPITLKKKKKKNQYSTNNNANNNDIIKS